jgi:hypothetical protein
VGCFNVKSSKVIVLIGVLAVIALILILPQVDLLDTAFQRSTSPLAIRATSISAPQASIAGIILNFARGRQVQSLLASGKQSAYALPAGSLQILNQSLRC